MSGPGKLYIVGTPIGNLDDLSLRAAKVLGRVDLVAAEDTRRTGKLLAHLGISPKLVSYREHNRAKVGPRLVREMLEGRSIGLVTDAGTPGVSDPGPDLVRLAREASLEVVPIPGPSAVATALSASGMEADRFAFLGFPPSKTKARREFYEALAGQRETIVFYEAPHRLAASLADLAEAVGNRPIILCRELTKLNEEIRAVGVEELAEWAAREKVRGEITLVLEGAPERMEPASQEEAAQAWREVRSKGRSPSRAAKELAPRLNWKRAEIYNLGLDLEKSAEAD